MTLDDYLRAQPGRCASCGVHIATQPHLHKGGCLPTGQRLRDQGMAAAAEARPDDRARVDAAIRTLAATGKPFSANDARDLHGVTGGVVGAAFTAARKAGLIRAVGDEGSNSESTHGHRIYRWVGTAA